MTTRIEPFKAIAISELAHRLKADGKPVIHMEFGQPSTGAPQAAIDTAHAVLDSDAMGYWESARLRERIARHYHERYGVEIAPDRVLLTAGASPALLLSMLAGLEPGARIAMARPGYVAYRNTVRAVHLEAVEIDCGPETRFQLSAQMIADMDPAPAGIVIASPANPTGTILPPDEMEAIAAICRDRGIRIISDEIYHGLSYGMPAASALQFDETAFIVNSFSKYYSMVGWRLGWVIAPADRADLARAYRGNLFLTPPSLSQHAALAAMDCRAELDAHVETYRANRAVLLEALPRMGLTSIAPPDGAFYIWADIGHLTDNSMAFCERLLRETFVATAPGVDFDPVNGHRFMRISFAVSTPQVKEAIQRLEPWFGALTR
ncbi:aminotransferase [Glycocaulis albus]|uniref:Aminotransferase n=1 Tax=Glycocaulis albus TaxID=1382801 RepID=A0ABQ1XJ46_9PROT|nr:aminotransferase class I/II-fold pyridoxal phosphate-dependent enzyme [Glycocaulis albus]MBV5259143.1 aminotransferase class I/II-fold pyridoxal phosphate-dependent enzyme [Synechococcus moorigangaii CMS01]GGG94994.1 aminotransferase [Glycocaulis albus]